MTDDSATQLKLHRPQAAAKGEALQPTPSDSVQPRDPAADLDLRAVLRQEELDRTRVFFRAVIGIVVLTAVFMPVLGGPTWIRALSAASALSTATVSVFVLRLLSAAPHRYTPRLAAVIAVLLTVFGVVIIYYVGLFSAGAMALALGVYFFGMSHSRLVARTAYASVALLYLLTSAGVAGGLLPDLSLFSTRNAAAFTPWFQVIMSQVIFALTLYLARSSRRATEAAVDRMARAHRRIRRKDALLNEARQELDKALAPLAGRLTGQTVGDYQLAEVLGRGAMGEVYRAKSKQGLPVAVKLLHPGMSDDETVVQRFLQEAEAVAAIPTEHVPRILSTGTAQSGEPFLAMELLEGHDLGWHLRRNGRLTLEQVVDLVEQVSVGLAAVRDAGIVHRDLKPANLFLTDSIPRKWKVLDFGLSKIVQGGASLTQGGAVGTPSYMAPEQIRGPSVGHSADVYALAAIAYRAIAGRPTFFGKQVAQVLYRVLYDQPEAPSDFAAVPVDVELVLGLGLAKDPGVRFGTAEELAAALRSAANGELDDETRTRGFRHLKSHPWGSSRRKGRGSPSDLEPTDGPTRETSVKTARVG